MLYQMEINQDYSKERKELFLSHYLDKSLQEEYFARELDTNTADQSDYLNKMFEMISDHLDTIDQILASAVENWKIERIAKVDLAVLRLSVTELFYFDDIPDSASINEAVELAKKFGGDDSGKFVNGILGRVVKEKDVKKAASGPVI
jgi:transcription antitermination protein NusB